MKPEFKVSFWIPVFCTIKLIMKKLLIQCMIFYTFFTACEKVIDYPIVPDIRFKSAIATFAIDNLGNPVQKVELTFTLRDGDGDIGLQPGDTNPPYTGKYRSNFFPTLYIKKQGRYEKDTSVIVSNYIIPYIESRGQNPALKADIIVEFNYSVFAGQPPKYDTIRYEFYMVDRALHHSDTLITPDIFFR